MRTILRLVILHMAVWLAMPLGYSQLGGYGDTGAGEAETLVDIQVIPAVKTVAPGDSFYALIQFTLKSKYHIYWKAPGMSGLAPKLTWDLPDGVTAKELYWPVPKPFTLDMGPDFPPDLSFGYEDELSIVQRFEVSKDVPMGSIPLSVDVFHQLCKETCFNPETKTVSASVDVGPATIERDVVQAQAEALLKAVPQPIDRWSVDATVVGDELTLVPKGGDVNAITSLIFMPYDNKETVKLGVKQVWKDGMLKLKLQPTRKGGTASGILVRDKPWAEGGSRGLEIEFQTVAGEKSAVDPQDSASDAPKKGTLVDAGHGFFLLDAEVDELPFEVTYQGKKIGVTEEGEGAVEGVAKQESLSTVLKYIFFAFLGGLILNVMPCVLPVLSIKAMSIVNSAHEDRKEIFKGSMAYTLGIMVSFLALATVVAVAKAAGKQAGWGAHMQSPGFVLFLFVIIWVFALSLFDLFIIQVPGMQKANEISGKKGHLGSFFSGVFAVLLSTPCTAPLLGSAIGFLFSQSIAIVYVAFIAVGLGLALPFILLGLTPAAVKWIPKPGSWMNVFREVMGFLLIGTAVFIAYILKSHLREHFFGFLIFVVPLSFSCWLYGKAAGPGASAKRNVLVLLIAAVISIGSGYWLITIPKPLKIETDLTAELMRKALVDEKRMVFLDFGADWCGTCKLNENTVLYSKDVQAAFQNKKVLLLKGDHTSYGERTSKWLKEFGRAGVPLYVILRPGETIEAEVLPELITKGMVIDALNK